MLKLLNYELGYCLWVRLLQNFVQLDLAGVDKENGTTFSVNFMEASRHELANDILLAHEVVIEQHVDLETASPDDIIA